MKTALLPVILCTMLIFGCATSHSPNRAWEYKATTTWPQGVGGEIARSERQGWTFVSMSSAAKGQDNDVTVVLLFRKPK